MNCTANPLRIGYGARVDRADLPHGIRFQLPIAQPMLDKTPCRAFPDTALIYVGATAQQETGV